MADPQYTPATRVCSKCHTEKPLADFSPGPARRDGRIAQCRACIRAQFRSDPKRVARHRERARLWWQTEKGKQRQQSKRQQYRPVYEPLKESARRKLAYAIRMGRVVRPPFCLDCGKEGRVHAHHSDYRRPFDVKWLCPSCHGKRHRKDFMT
jgi:hypothetical protein